MRLFSLLPVLLAAGIANAAAPGGDEALVVEDANHARANLLDRDLETRSVVSQILSAIESAATCTACEVMKTLPTWDS